MKIVFVARGNESLSIGYLSAVLKNAGHETALVFDPALFGSDFLKQDMLQNIFSYRKKIVKKIKEEKAGLVAFSVVSDEYGWACETASAIKADMDIPVIFGGIHPTLVPERVIRENFVDYICVGEGEDAIVELADTLENKKDPGNIANIWSKAGGKIKKNAPRTLIKNLDALPSPDKQIFYKEFKEFVKGEYSIIASRDCFYSCTYCYNNYMGKVYNKGKKLEYRRRRSEENVINELKSARREYGIKKVIFFDDLFIDDLEWLKSFAIRYKKEVNLPFLCNVHSAFINEETVSCLVQAGCVKVALGVQSIDETVRRNVLGRNESNEEIKRSIQLFQNTGIFLKVDLILGLPNQKEEELIEAAKFFNEYRPDVLMMLWLRYYPKTKIVTIAREQGVLTSQDIEEIETSKVYYIPVLKGNTFNPQLGKLGNFVFLSPFLPRGVLKWLIRKKTYNYFPSSARKFYIVVYVLIHGFKKFFSMKKKNFIYHSFGGQIKYYLHYLFR